MPDLQLHLQDHRHAFVPGESVTGTASWRTENPPQKAEVSLIWSTRGKGTPDMEIVETITFPGPTERDSRNFQIKLPPAPYSFSGQLISLVWTIELNLDPGAECESLEIVIAPAAKEVMLPRIGKSA